LVASSNGLAVFSCISRPHFSQSFQVFQTREIAIDVLCPARIPNIGVHHGISSVAMISLPRFSSGAIGSVKQGFQRKCRSFRQKP
jgi:hypothetical protein